MTGIGNKLDWRRRLLFGSNPFSLRERIRGVIPLRRMNQHDLLLHSLRSDADGEPYFLLGGLKLYFEPRGVIDRGAMLRSVQIILSEAFLDPDEMFCEQVNLRPGDVAIDLGGNIGTSAIAFSRRVGPTGRVYTFEPVTHEPLARNLRTNGIDNVTLVPVGVGDRVGTADIAICDHLIDSSIARAPGAAEHLPVRTQTIDLVTIDRFVEREGLERVDLIKVDIEGAEELAIRGARNTIEHLRPRWTIASYHTDFEGDQQHPKLVRALQEHGYETREVFARGRGVRIYAW